MAEMIKPVKLNPEISECLIPSSMLMRFSRLFESRFFIILTSVSEIRNTSSPVTIEISEMLMPPTLKPNTSFFTACNINAPGIPHSVSSE